MDGYTPGYTVIFCGSPDEPQLFLAALDQLLAIATYAKIGSDLKALNNTSWIATA